MSDQQAKIIKKKVKPYPFDAFFEINAQKTPVEVIFLNNKGMIVRLKNQILHVGAILQISFEIPVAKHSIVTEVRVLKTYDKTLDLKEKTVERLAELHFQQLTNTHRSRINQFMAAIGQE